MVVAAALGGSACEKAAAARLSPLEPSASTDAAAKTFRIAGSVTDAMSAQPIAGARVQIIVSPHTFSDDRGAFMLVGVASGRSLLEVTKDGYQLFERQIVVDDDMQMTVTLSPVTR